MFDVKKAKKLFTQSNHHVFDWFVRVDENISDILDCSICVMKIPTNEVFIRFNTTDKNGENLSSININKDIVDDLKLLGNFIAKNLRHYSYPAYAGEYIRSFGIITKPIFDKYIGNGKNLLTIQTKLKAVFKILED